MKPWEDETLLQMIVFAQMHPEESLDPLRDRIQEMQYSDWDLHTNQIFDQLKKFGYQLSADLLQWYQIKLKIGLKINHTALLSFDKAIPFPDPQ